MSTQIERKWRRAESHFHAGSLDAAKVACESLLSQRSHHPAAHWMLSRIHQSQKQFRSATHHARLAAADFKQLPLQQKLAVSRRLISVGEYWLARDCLHAIPASVPLDAFLLAEIVEQSSMLDDHAHAGSWLEIASARSFRNPQISFLRGNNWKFIGDFDAAASAYEEAIAITPGDVHAHHALAGLSLKEGGAIRIDRLRRLVSPPRQMQSSSLQSDQGANDPAVLHYALFKELDQLGEVDAAWEALERAMHYKQALIRHDAQAENAIFDSLIETCSESFVSGGQAQEDSNIPIFIVGMPRTGTTIVERVLGNHPQLTACGELSELRMRYKWASDYYCSAFLDGEAVARMANVDAQALGKAYLASTAWRTKGRRWFTDKHPGNFLFSALILRAIPNARIINVRRSAMDSCFANLKELFAPHYYEYSYAMDDVANHYRNYSRWMTHVSQASQGRVLNVEYEDFVHRPAQETARILDFCGLPQRAGITDVFLNENPVSTGSSVQVREPIHTRRIGSWKRYEKYLAPLQDRVGFLSGE